MTQIVGRNEAIAYVDGMARQRDSEGMEYPTNTNMRGGARAGGSRGENDRERHAAGDAVGADDEREAHAMGMDVGRFIPRDNVMRSADNVMRSAMKRGGMMDKKDCR
jgi:hypothetical protein